MLLDVVLVLGDDSELVDDDAVVVAVKKQLEEIVTARSEIGDSEGVHLVTNIKLGEVERVRGGLEMLIKFSDTKNKIFVCALRSIPADSEKCGGDRDGEEQDIERLKYFKLRDQTETD